MFTLISTMMSLNVIAATSGETFKPITIRYRQRAPYIVKKWGELSGPCGEAVIKAFKKAKIDFHTAETPFLRQMAQFLSNGEPICSIGWLKTAKREEFLKFSGPICEDGPWVVVGHKGTISPSVSSVLTLLKNPELKIARRTHFSFGEDLDGLIEKNSTPIINIDNPEYKQVLDMILAGRADYTLLSEREFLDLTEKHNFHIKDFTVLKPDDLKGPHLRYMVCTRGVPDAVIKKFNKAVSSINQ
ncbi:hypothetical protein ACLVWU_02840 [Bdellovibrio sp. HCB290]|uniref:hypothetical protein n=1 Tax=Bdellovibrio sp. HCB290 TaxID=3394356 RepID=UPI0039B3BC4F